MLLASTLAGQAGKMLLTSYPSQSRRVVAWILHPLIPHDYDGSKLTARIGSLASRSNMAESWSKQRVLELGRLTPGEIVRAIGDDVPHPWYLGCAVTLSWARQHRSLHGLAHWASHHLVGLPQADWGTFLYLVLHLPVGHPVRLEILSSRGHPETPTEVVLQLEQYIWIIRTALLVTHFREMTAKSQRDARSLDLALYRDLVSVLILEGAIHDQECAWWMGVV